MKKTISISDLIGIHTFSGFESGIIVPKKDKYDYADSDAVLFILDNVTYMAVENPDDGYRSSLDSLFITTEQICKNKIPPHIVQGRMRADGSYDKNDTIEFVDIITKEVVLAIGTDNTDDYYPMCVMSFSPTELAINKDPKGYQHTMREYKLKRILNDKN